jgi:hypothetical protein
MYQIEHTIFTCNASRSTSLYTATVFTPSFRAVRMTRHAISPLLAVRSVEPTIMSHVYLLAINILLKRGFATLSFLTLPGGETR